jgi:hypothetical protein
MAKEKGMLDEKDFEDRALTVGLLNPGRRVLQISTRVGGMPIMTWSYVFGSDTPAVVYITPIVFASCRRGKISLMVLL